MGVVSTGVFAVTADASANTKGPYTEFSASTAADCDGFVVSLSGMSDGQNLRFLMDVAIGAAASEVVIVPNIPISCVFFGPVATKSMYFPVAIAAGTRIAIRVQCSTGSQIVYPCLHLIASALAENMALGSPVAHDYGTTGASTRGTAVDPGGTALSFGAYSELVAATSTAHDIEWLVVYVWMVNNTVPSAANFRVEIATGGLGAEVVLIPNFSFSSRGANPGEGFFPHCFVFPVTIPTGTRLSARALSDINDATDRLFDLSLIAVEGTVASTGSGAGIARLAGGGLVH